MKLFCHDKNGVILGYDNGTHIPGSFHVLTGKNEVPDEIWEKVKDKKGVMGWLAGGVIEVGDGPKPEPEAPKEPVVDMKTTEVFDITSVKVSEAVPMVTEEEDVQTLMAWQDAESRKTVLEAIEGRLEDLDE